jgi:hypothetical protein
MLRKIDMSPFQGSIRLVVSMSGRCPDRLLMTFKRWSIWLADLDPVRAAFAFASFLQYLSISIKERQSKWQTAQP